MRGFVTLFVAAIFVAACQTGPTDSSGTQMLLEEQDATIHSSISWLPEPFIRWSRDFTYTERDNTHPIVEIDFAGRRGEYYAQYIREYYMVFSRDTAELIQSEDGFKEMVRRAGLRENQIDEYVQVGNPFSRVGGWYGLYDQGTWRCVIAQIGAGMTTYASQAASDGKPYDSVLRVMFCGTVEERDEVIEFVLSPEPVTDREAFAEYVDEIQQGSNGKR